MLESSPRSAEAVRRAAVVPHGKAERLGDALARLERVAAGAGVELVDADGEPDVAIVLGGDGTMLRALHAFLGTDVPVVHADPRPGDVDRHFADTAKAARLFGFRPTVDLEDGLARTIDWVRTSGLASRADATAAGQPNW